MEENETIENVSVGGNFWSWICCPCCNEEESEDLESLITANDQDNTISAPSSSSTGEIRVEPSSSRFNGVSNKGNMETPRIIFVGNPGVGKSSLLNCVAGKLVFRSGTSTGKGLTYKLTEKTVGNTTFCDTPGLEDNTYRKQAGEAISKLLKQGGICKIFFVVTEEAGRIRPQDTATMKVILDAAPEIGNRYGIIVNKLSKKNACQVVTTK